MWFRMTKRNKITWLGQEGIPLLVYVILVREGNSLASIKTATPLNLFTWSADIFKLFLWARCRTGHMEATGILSDVVPTHMELTVQ